MTLLEEPCPCGSKLRRIANPQGRSDDLFHYGRVAVHPHVFRSPLSRARHVMEYQVRQTTSGAEIAVVSRGSGDDAAIEGEIARSLAELGLEAPVVSLCRVEAIDRIAAGKLKRFIALPH